MADLGTMPFGMQKPIMTRPQSLVTRWARRPLAPGPELGQALQANTLGNPERAAAFYAGHFECASETITASPLDVFTIKTGPPAWRASLMDLDWLQDFAASNRKLHDHYALRLLHHWSQSVPAKLNVARLTKILSRLAIHGTALARRCEPTLQKEFLQIVQKQWQALSRARPTGHEDATAKAIGQLYGLAAFQNLKADPAEILAFCEAHIDHVILPGGGHCSGDMSKLLSLLDLALPLLQTEKPILPKAFGAALMRSLGLIQMLKRRDGTLSIVAGIAPQRPLPAHHFEGEIPRHAPNSGFARLEQEKSILFAKTNGVPEIEFTTGQDVVFHSIAPSARLLRPAEVSSCAQGTGLALATTAMTRTCYLAADGFDLRIEDHFSVQAGASVTLMVPNPVRLSLLQEGATLMLVMPDQSVWHLRQRGARYDIQKSPQHHQITMLVSGSRLNWSLKKQAKSPRSKSRKAADFSDLLI
jgi:hypothetical protein